MNDNTYNALTQYYLNIVATNPRKAVSLLKALDILVGGGPLLVELERVLDKVDECALIKTGAFKMNMANGGGNDPLARAISHVSD